VEAGIDSMSLNPDSVLKTILKIVEVESRFRNVLFFFFARLTRVVDFLNLKLNNSVFVFLRHILA